MNINRREFLKISSKSAIVGGAYLGLPLSLEANASFSDYKALVCVMLHGGNDSMNTFIPSGDDADKGYAKYASIRRELTISNTPLDANIKNNYAHSSGLAPDAYLKGFYKHSNIDGLATNALMPEVAKLIDSGKIAIVANMGTLVEPTTRATIKSVELPKNLFSHNTQRRIVESGVANDLKVLGWAGRLFDEWQEVNASHPYGMNVSYAGNPYMFNAKATSPLVLSTGAPQGYSAINNTDDTERATLYSDLNTITYTNPFKRIYNTMLGNSFSLVDSLSTDWTNSHTFSSTNDYGTIFNIPSNTDLGLEDIEIKTDFLEQLRAVAKMIEAGKAKGLKRQIFYVKLNGFDTHSGQLGDHPKLLRALSLGMGDFQKAIAELSSTVSEDEVTTFTLSDFGRSTGSNGDGTDHAWGGHYFVMGGAVKGGLYGTLPDLNLGGIDDSGSKGRLIPTTSTDEYLSTLLTWYGVDSTVMHKILPNLKNFSTPDLGFFCINCFLRYRGIRIDQGNKSLSSLTLY